MALEKSYLDAFCNELEEIGWEELEPQKLDNFIIKQIFEKKLEEINRDIFSLYKEKWQEILSQVYLALQGMNEVKVLDSLRFGVNVIIRKGNTQIPLTIRLIDYEETENNQFNYIREQEIIQGIRSRYPDILLFINGIPLILVEGKSPLLSKTFWTYWEGLKQIMRYQYEIAGLFKFVQFAVSYADEKPYIPTFPRDKELTPSGYSFWKTKKGKKYEEDILDLLNPRKILNILRFFIFFTKDKQGNTKKIMARYMQYNAVKKAMERIDNYLSGKEEKNQGLVWHWQGSGKTYTMFFIAYQFLIKYQAINPLIFFTIDRLELEKQLEGVLKSIEHKLVRPKRVTRIEELGEIIENIDKEWGLKITTIQKFKADKLDIIGKEVNRKSILFLIDEAHRSQYGDLAATMRKVFKKAMFFGFTGTPVFKNNKNTFQYFAYYPNELYLDSYFIHQSQEDGFTLPLTVRVVQEKKFEILLKEDEIQAIMQGLKITNSEDLDSLLSYQKKIGEKLKRKIRRINAILESEPRIRRFADYITKKVEEDTEGWKFKAMIVAPSRKACVLYKKILDESLKKRGYSENATEVVMSYQQNEDSPEISDFRENLLKRYKVKDWQKANEIIRENFLKKENPKILIVTDMLLTGFDAPILKAMYLDKPIYYHKLLQAVARVNRPAEDKKTGLIVDSIGIMAHLKKTLDMYNYLVEGTPEEIKEDLKNAFVDVKKELEWLNTYLEDVKKELSNFGINFEQIIEYISNNDAGFYDLLDLKISEIVLKMDEEKTGKDIRLLLKNMKEILDIYKSLGATPEKLDYKKQVTAIWIIYSIFQKKFGKEKYSRAKQLYKEILRKVYEYTVVGEITKKIESRVSTLGKKKPSIREAATTYYYIKNITTLKLGNPLYKQIYEKLIRLQKGWVTRNTGVEEFIKKIGELSKELSELESIEKSSTPNKIKEMINTYLKNNKIHLELNEELFKKIREVYKKKRILDTDKKEIKSMIIKSMLRSKIPISEARKLENDLFNIIFGELSEKIRD